MPAHGRSRSCARKSLRRASADALFKIQSPDGELQQFLQMEDQARTPDEGQRESIGGMRQQSNGKLMPLHSVSLVKASLRYLDCHMGSSGSS